MLKYTICFIQRGEEILLVNREKSPWMGRWNGVGGKLEPNETPTDCVLREVEEETGIILDSVDYKGLVTWTVDENELGGMYAYVAKVPEDFHYPTPFLTREGILDWKEISWICHPDNFGVANIHYYLLAMLNDPENYDHRFIYEGDNVLDYQPVLLKETTKSLANK
jgi:8-oxo-dGTP diphosphatase